jgi:hypothetical protein
MLGLEVAQVNKGEEFESNPSGQLAKNRHSTSLRFPFACLANKRRKVVRTPFASYPSTGPDGEGLQLSSASVLRAFCPDQLKESRNGTTDDVNGHGTTRCQ